jgi:hypothetical protein
MGTYLTPHQHWCWSLGQVIHQHCGKYIVWDRARALYISNTVGYFEPIDDDGTGVNI